MSALEAIPAPTRSDAIDAMRGFCAAWVALTHFITWSEIAYGAGSVPGWLVAAIRSGERLFQPNGEHHPAVLAFIVLSGYCIHRNGFRSGAFDVRSYALRRFFRIYPVYVLAVLVGAVCFAVAVLADPQLARFLSGTGEISLDRFALKLSGISAIFPSLHLATIQGNGPLHTVMVEMWLYALYPAGVFLMLAQSRLIRCSFWIAFGTTWLAGIWWCSSSQVLTHWWIHGSVVGFVLYWWVGAWAACFARTTFTRGVWPTITLILLSSSFLIGFIPMQSLILLAFKQLVLAGAVTCFLIQIETFRHNVLAPAAWFGRISYSLYALHGPIIYAMLALKAPLWTILPSVSIASWVSCLLFEEPLRSVGRSLSRRRASA